MLLSDRRIFLLGLTALAGCGFEPVYKAGSAASGLFGEFDFKLIESREGFELIERLESRLGVGGASAKYSIAIGLTFRQEGLAISSENAITRYNVFGTATIAVTSTTSEKVIYRDTLSAITAYSATASTAATASARRDAYRRSAHALADRIIARLAETSEGWAE